jgi:prevent-host-death family protein
MVTTLVDMADATIRASEFKARCLALLDEVAETGRPLVVTKHGRPVARVVPLDPPMSLLGSVTTLVDDDELLFSTGETWDADG